MQLLFRRHSAIKKAGVLLSISAFLFQGCQVKPDASEKPENASTAPLNVIFMIGDGMGTSQVTTMFYYKDEPSVFEQFKEIGFINTSSSSNKVTDSAAAGTAFATGQKSFNRGLGLNPDSVPVTSILSVLQIHGYETGLVTIGSITHATPAAFYAKVTDRDMEESIAEQLLYAGVDFFAGGGLDFFKKREDGQDLYQSLENRGYKMDTLGLSPVTDTSLKYGYLLAPNGLPAKHKGRDSFLKEATEQALAKLSASDSGFFLMVEGSYIDWAGHARDKEFMLAEMLDFEEAMAVALRYVDAHENTLLIVTGDHETGGMSVGKGDQIDQVDLYFNTDQHTADLVPVFAKGRGAEGFKGFYQNSDVFHKILKAAGIQNDKIALVK